MKKKFIVAGMIDSLYERYGFIHCAKCNKTVLPIMNMRDGSMWVYEFWGILHGCYKRGVMELICSE